jgi:hypothetical protein
LIRHLPSTFVTANPRHGNECRAASRLLAGSPLGVTEGNHAGAWLNAMLDALAMRAGRQSMQCPISAVIAGAGLHHFIAHAWAGAGQGGALRGDTDVMSRIPTQG